MHVFTRALYWLVFMFAELQREEAKAMASLADVRARLSIAEGKEQEDKALVTAAEKTVRAHEAAGEREIQRHAALCVLYIQNTDTACLRLVCCCAVKEKEALRAKAVHAQTALDAARKQAADARAKLAEAEAVALKELMDGTPWPDGTETRCVPSRILCVAAAICAGADEKPYAGRHSSGEEANVVAAESATAAPVAAVAAVVSGQEPEIGEAVVATPAAPGTTALVVQYIRLAGGCIARW
jgi:hypothetical protein